MAQRRAPGTSLRIRRAAAMARGHLLVVPVHLHFLSEVFHEALKPYSFWGAENLQWRRRGSCRRQSRLRAEESGLRWVRAGWPWAGKPGHVPVKTSSPKCSNIHTEGTRKSLRQSHEGTQTAPRKCSQGAPHVLTTSIQPLPQAYLQLDRGQASSADGAPC